MIMNFMDYLCKVGLIEKMEDVNMCCSICGSTRISGGSSTPDRCMNCGAIEGVNNTWYYDSTAVPTNDSIQKESAARHLREQTGEIKKEEMDMKNLEDSLIRQVMIKENMMDALKLYGKQMMTPPDEVMQEARDLGIEADAYMTILFARTMKEKEEALRNPLPDYEEIVDEPEFERMTILLPGKSITFMGRYRRDLEKPQWHYYETEEGKIQHFRKSAMQGVLKGNKALVYP